MSKNPQTIQIELRLYQMLFGGDLNEQYPDIADVPVEEWLWQAAFCRTVATIPGLDPMVVREARRCAKAFQRYAKKPPVSYRTADGKWALTVSDK